jgi:hypothetical protein
MPSTPARTLLPAGLAALWLLACGTTPSSRPGDGDRDLDAGLDTGADTGGGDGDTPGDTGGDVITIDTGGGDTEADAGPECSSDRDCLDLFGEGWRCGFGTCERFDPDVGPECVTDRDCRVQFGDGFSCVGGGCVADPLGGCQELGQPCSDPLADSTDRLACVVDPRTGTASCQAWCDPRTGDGGGLCVGGTYCVALELEGVGNGFGACMPATCGSTFFDPTACDPGEACVPFGQRASFCLPTGSAGPGEPCTAQPTLQPDPALTCDAGLLCASGVCAVPCDQNDPTSCAASGDDCVAVLRTAGENRPGLCGVECPPFSTDACPDGQRCTPFTSWDTVSGWMCVPEAGDLLGRGEDCSTGASCGTGLVCVPDGALDASVTTASCQPLCDPAGSAGAACGDGEVCVELIDGLGTCRRECEPYPRRAGGYGCDNASDTCVPDLANDNDPSTSFGYCLGTAGDLEPYAPCRAEGSFAECADLGLCFDPSGGGNPSCQPLCEPLSIDGQCGPGATCSPLLPLVGFPAYAACERNPQPGEVGDACSLEGQSCSGDGTLCLDAGSGLTCIRICSDARTDVCPRGSRCQTGIFDPAQVPEYMGVCF